MQRRRRSTPPDTRPALPARLLAGLLALTVGLIGCPPAYEGLSAAPGAIDYQRDARIPFPMAGVSGHVDALGGNLLIRRVDLSIDTRLGTLEVGAVYNSAVGKWRFSFEPHYGAGVFTDESGAIYDVGGLPDGAAIPGSHWVKLDARRIQTKSGRVYAFDTTGRLSTITWGQASWPRLIVDYAHVAARTRPVGLRQCSAPESCEPVYDLTYDTVGHPTAIEDRTGRRAELDWKTNRLVAARDGLDVEEGRPGFRYTYAGAMLRSITNGEDERTEIDYEGVRVARVRRIGEGDPTDTFHYTDAVDGLYATRHWNALGHEKVYRYDAERRLRAIWNVALDEQTAWAWSGTRPSIEVAPDGSMRFFTWVDDDLVREARPNGNVRLLRYAPEGTDREDPSHRPIAGIDDSIGLVEERSYDSAGRLIVLRDGAGDETTFFYDANSNLARVVSPHGTHTELSGYGNHGHPALVQRAGSFFPQQIRSFDGVGNRVHGARIGQTGQGGVGDRLFDGDRNVRRIGLDSGEAIEIDVRGDRRRTRILRPDGADHLMSYDALGRLATRAERVDGALRTTHFEYDLLDRRTAVEQANGMRQELAFDAAGRVTAIRNLRNGSLEGEASFRYERGRLVETMDSLRGGTERFVRDEAGRVVVVEHVSGRTTTYAHDRRDRRTRVAFFDASQSLVRAIHRDYDEANRVVAVRDGLTTVLERDYVAGRLSEQRYGNGLVRGYAYEPEGGPLASTEMRNAADQIIETTRLERNLVWPVALLEATTTTTGTSGGVSATSEERYALSPFGHDGAPTHRPQVTHFTGSGSGLPLDFGFAYDDRSNLVTEGTTTFHYNGERNRLKWIDFEDGSTLHYDYDDAGFATSRAGLDIAWHPNGRIASHGPDAFTWDVTGSPLTATVDGSTTRALFDGSVIGDANGVPLRIDLDEVSLDLQGGGRLYRHLDFRLNVKLTTDDAGVVRSLYTYSPFRVEEVLGDDEDAARFVGRAEIGELMLMGARVYDPAAGRFLSPDPVFQVVNQYAYTLGNPVQFHDRSGTNPEGQADSQSDGAARQAAVADALTRTGNALLFTAAILMVAGLPSLAAAMGLAGIILHVMAGSMTARWRLRRREVAPLLT